jgi:hypothetical protein
MAASELASTGPDEDEMDRIPFRFDGFLIAVWSPPTVAGEHLTAHVEEISQGSNCFCSVILYSFIFESR